jgi:predicted nucleotidyltransferase
MIVIETDKQQVEKVVRAFADELIKQFGGQIYEIIWYGSTARGEAEAGSDIDVAIICRKEDFVTQEKIGSIASKVGLEYGILIDAQIIASERFYGEWGRLSYYAEDIQNEGVSIWKRSGDSMGTN